MVVVIVGPLKNLSPAYHQNLRKFSEGGSVPLFWSSDTLIPYSFTEYVVLILSSYTVCAEIESDEKKCYLKNIQTVFPNFFFFHKTFISHTFAFFKAFLKTEILFEVAYTIRARAIFSLLFTARYGQQTVGDYLTKCH